MSSEKKEVIPGSDEHADQIIEEIRARKKKEVAPLEGTSFWALLKKEVRYDRDNYRDDTIESRLMFLGTKQEAEKEVALRNEAGDAIWFGRIRQKLEVAREELQVWEERREAQSTLSVKQINALGIDTTLPHSYIADLKQRIAEYEILLISGNPDRVVKEYDHYWEAEPITEVINGFNFRVHADGTIERLGAFDVWLDIESD